MCRQRNRRRRTSLRHSLTPCAASALLLHALQPVADKSGHSKSFCAVSLAGEGVVVLKQSVNEGRANVPTRAAVPRRSQTIALGGPDEREGHSTHAKRRVCGAWPASALAASHPRIQQPANKVVTALYVQTFHDMHKILREFAKEMGVCITSQFVNPHTGPLHMRSASKVAQN
jgi:uncharacterized protein (DUF3084 family)